MALTAAAAVESLWHAETPRQFAREMRIRGFTPLTRRLVELAGFEPAAPSLREMRSKLFDQGKRHPVAAIWNGCGASDVRCRESP